MPDSVGIRSGGMPATISGRGAIDTHTAYQADAPNLTHKSGQMTMIWRVNSRKTASILKEHRMMSLPVTVTITPEARSSMHYTAGGVYWDTLGIEGPVRWAINGHTGIRGQNLPTGVVVDGMASCLDLAETIRFYFSGNSTKPAISGHDRNDLFLTFIDESYPVSFEAPDPPEWIAHPTERLVTIPRDAHKPFVYPYQFDFVAVRRDLRSELRTTALRRSFRPRSRTLLQELNGLLNEMASLDSLVGGALDAILGPQGRTFVETGQRYRASIETVVDQFARFSSGLTSLVDSTFETVNSVIADGESIRSSIISIVDLVTGGNITGEHAYMLAETLRIRRRMNSLLLFAQGYGWAQTARATSLLEKRGSTATYSRGTSRVAEALGRTNVPVKLAVDPSQTTVGPLAAVTLSEGESLESWASRLGIDVALLIAINNLEHPYIDTSQTRPATDPRDALGRNVLYRGESLLVPGAVEPVVALENQILLPPENSTDDSGSAFSLEERLFGSDLAFDFEAGDLVLDPATGDLRTVSALDNLVQSIELGWHIQVGELHHHPAWGNYVEQEVGSTLTRPSRELAALGCRKTLQLNPRIASLTYMKATGGAGVLTVDFEAAAIGGTRLLEGSAPTGGS